MSVRGIALVVIAALCALAGLTGCAQQANDKNTMSVAWTSNAGEYNLDPTNNYMGWQGSYLGIYEQLFRIDGSFQVQPLLAESAEMTGPTTWKITIRDNITFQNGKAVDAQAVKASLQRAIDKNTRAAKSLDIKNMTAEGQVLTVETNTQNVGFKNELCEPVTSIIDVDSGAADDRPVGTGPFKMENEDSSGNVDLTAYEGAIGREPDNENRARPVFDRRPVKGVGLADRRGVGARERCRRPVVRSFRFVEIHPASDESGTCAHAVFQHEECCYAG